MKLSLLPLVFLAAIRQVDAAGAISSSAVTNAIRVGLETTPGYLVSPPQQIAFDAGGNLYLAAALVGKINAPNKTRFGSPDDRDIYVLKISPTHQLLYVAQIGGSDYDRLAGMAVDHDGNVFLSGTTASPDFPTTPGAFRSESAVGGSFVLKLDPTGQKLLYSTLIAPFSTATCLTIDDDGNAYVGGWSDYPTFPTTAGAYQERGLPGMHAGFLSEISPDGTKLVFSTRLSGSTGPDTITAVALDATGVIHVAGAAGSADFPITPGANKTVTGGDSVPQLPAFLARLDSAGAHLLYSTLLPQYQDVEALAVDRNGATYLAGDRRGGYRGVMHLTKIAAGGQLVYDKAFGGSLYQTTTSMLLMDDGSVMLGGFTDSPDFPTRDSLQHCNPNESMSAGIVLAVDPGGNMTRSSLLGGVGEVLVTAFGRDLNGGIHVAGVTTWQDFPGGVDLLPSTSSTWLFTFDFDPARATRGQPAPACFVHGATYQPTPVVPGMIGTVFGSNLGPAAGVTFTAGDDGRVPTELAGMRVMVGGVLAAVLYAQDSQINFVIPNQPGNPPDVCVSAAGSDPTCISETSALLNPGVLGGVFNEDGSVNTAANPAPRGSTIVVFTTGMGPYDRDLPDGSIATEPFAMLSATVTATFDDQTVCAPFSPCFKKFFPADVTYAGEAPGMPAGATQVKVMVPNNAISGNLGLTLVVTLAGGGNARTFTTAWVK